MSSLLFYGPGAEEEATTRAESLGRLLAPPFGSEGLKVDDAREIVTLLAAPPVGTQIGVVLAGPMDRATPEAMDALLKSLEDFDEQTVQPVLWAVDVGAVVPTIRSRCLLIWCPDGPMPEMEHLEMATDLVRAALRRDYPTVIFAVKEFEGDNRDLLASVAMVLADKLKEAEGKAAEHLLILWDSVRSMLGGRSVVSDRELLAALVLPMPKGKG